MADRGKRKEKEKKRCQEDFLGLLSGFGQAGGARISEPGGPIAFCSGWRILIPVAARAYHRQLAGVAS